MKSYFVLDPSPCIEHDELGWRPEATFCFQIGMASKDALSVVEKASTAALAPANLP